MSDTNHIHMTRFNDVTDEWPGIDSRFRLVILAGLRSKQLLRGSLPRIMADPLKKKNTSIALEELKRGLIIFSPAETKGQQEL